MLLVAIAAAARMPKKKPVIEHWPDGTVIDGWFQDRGKVDVKTLGRQYVITDYGVKRDSTIVQTEALQMLIENAIKHNEHTQAHPLVVDVTADHGKLCVSNPKRLIHGAVSATVGQHNVVERYRLLTRKKVCIEDAPDHYRVTLPLLPA